MAYRIGEGGFEPPTPTSQTWCAPGLRHSPVLVGAGRFELPTSTSRTWRANRAALRPECLYIIHSTSSENKPNFRKTRTQSFLSRPNVTSAPKVGAGKRIGGKFTC